MQTKVKDHEHWTGIYKGSPKRICNLNFTLSNFILIVFYNFMRYDNLFIKELCRKDNTQLMWLHKRKIRFFF